MRDAADRILVEKALAGERQAFGFLAERYLKPAFGIAFAITSSPEDSEDLVQEAFLRSYRELGTLKRRERFWPWLVQIIRNLASDRGRKESRGRKALEEVARGQAAGEEPSREEPMDREEAMRFLKAA